MLIYKVGQRRLEAGGPDIDSDLVLIVWMTVDRR